MSKRSYFQRTKSIIKRLNTKPYCTFDEISAYIRKEFEYAGEFGEEDPGFSKRTFQRDIKEIYDVWGIEIVFCKKNRGYHIVKDSSYSDNSGRLFEVYEMMNALQIAEDLKDIVYFEQRQPLNTHYFDDVIAAVKRKVYLRITYCKFGAETPDDIKIAPYGLKEYRNRWYIVAKTNDKLRIYALDRIAGMRKTSERFQWDKSLDIGGLYKDVFGIYIDGRQETEQVELEVSPYLSNYIRTLPLHPSQEIVKEDAQSCQVRLQLKISDELVTELLSYGRHVKVLRPRSLQKAVVKSLQESLMQYPAAGDT